MSHQNKTKDIHLRLSEYEYELIQQRMDEMGIENMSSFMRKLAVDGYLVKLEIRDLKELIRLIRICSNNLNQYARKANGTDCIYYNDIVDLQVRLDEIWEMTRSIMEQLSKIK